MDLMVKKTQEWLNENYKGYADYVIIDEDGITGNSTVKALIRALQIELGVKADGSLGSKTIEKYSTLSRGSNRISASKKRQVFIIQGALYCKGYDPNGLDGGYGAGVEKAVKKLKTDAGLTSPDGNADKEFVKALLSTDAYVLSKKGDENIRTIQQCLNRDYHAYIGLIPCDGIFVKQTLRALVKGLQREEQKEYPETVIDGIWGNTTMSQCPIIRPNEAVKNSKYISILRYALYVNGFPTNGFDGTYTKAVETAVSNFQKYSGLNPSGIVYKQTWASLLVSYGDKNRKGKACDCMTPLTKATAKTLVDDGREIVGRYIIGGNNKVLTLDEERIIYDAGLRIMPIYQNTNNKASYFSKFTANRDAEKAYIHLCNLKIPNGTTFYVAVDYDASDYDIENIIIPYFETFKIKFDELNERDYKIGVYGPRYVCTQLSRAGLTTRSFVCDMSSGFSGNIGRRLPANWAFDQISTVKVGTGEGLIEIDNNITSGKDDGVVVNPDVKFEPTEMEKKKYIRFIVNDILNNYTFKELVSPDLQFEKEIQILMGPPVDVFVTPTLNVTENNNATYKVNITNGKIQDANFETTIKEITTSYSAIGDVPVPNYAAIAKEIGNGRMEISIGVYGEKLVIEEKYIVSSTENSVFSGDFAVSIKLVMGLEKPVCETVLQETWDATVETLKNVDWSTGFKYATGITIVLLVLATGNVTLGFNVLALFCTKYLSENIQ